MDAYSQADVSRLCGLALEVILKFRKTGAESISEADFFVLL
jgi:hypothetical protein